MRQGGLTFYLSRRISRWHYVVGKLLSIGLLVSLTTTVPALILYVQYGILTESTAYFRENLGILRREKLVERARDDIGPYLQRRWRELADHPLVGEVRGVGMIGALELVAHKGSRTFFRNRGATGLICRDHCFNNGLVMRATRDTMIMAPPLVIERSQVDEMIEKARRCLDLTAADIGVS